VVVVVVAGVELVTVDAAGAAALIAVAPVEATSLPPPQEARPNITKGLINLIVTTSDFSFIMEP
jgi:hypothetical protein